MVLRLPGRVRGVSAVCASVAAPPIKPASGLRHDFHSDVDDILSDAAPLQGWRKLRMKASVGKLPGEHVGATNWS